MPGTHDTRLLFNCINKLKNSKFKRTIIPKFNKAIYDKKLKKDWLKVVKKPDIVILVGWWVGAFPQKKKDLLIPINRLEKYYDKKKIWRNKVNQELKNDYSKIFKLIDKTIFLKVPSFKYVLKWRLLQEKKLRISKKGNKIMSDNQIKKFIMFYERLTKHMLKTLTCDSDTVIKVDTKHRLKSIKFN